MRHFSGRVGAILFSAIWATRLFAADAYDCANCSIANAIRSVSSENDGERSGLLAAGGYWVFNAALDDLQTYLSVATPGALSIDADEELDLFLHERAVEGPGNPIGEYLGAGLVYRSAAAEGWRRQFGVKVGMAELAAPFQRALLESGVDVAEREAIYELSGRIEISSGFALQSDVQFIRNPGMNAAVDSSWMIALRFEFSAR
jgi:hypothetical protein